MVLVSFVRFTEMIKSSEICKTLVTNMAKDKYQHYFSSGYIYKGANYFSLVPLPRYISELLVKSCRSIWKVGSTL